MISLITGCTPEPDRTFKSEAAVLLAEARTSERTATLKNWSPGIADLEYTFQLTCRTFSNFRGLPAVQAVDVGRPLCGWMPSQHRTVVLQIDRQLYLQRVLKLGRLQERPEQRGGREVCDAENLADKIGAALPLLLDAPQQRWFGLSPDCVR